MKERLKLGSISNFDIDQYFGKTVHYPRNKIPSKLNYGDVFNVNTDTSDGSGKHHVGLKIGKNEAYYFDSFGVIPLPEVTKVCKDNGLELVYNIYRIQDMNSNHCGNYVLDFLDSVYDFDSYNNWLLNYFPNDFNKNDRILFNRLGF